MFSTLVERKKCDVVRSNDPDYIAAANARLGIPGGRRASWLTGDQILELAHLNNPDGVTTGPSWLSGPYPYNLWATHFGQTLLQRNGRIYIAVVNTVSQTVDEVKMGGAHWYLTVWRVKEEE